MDAAVRGLWPPAETEARAAIYLASAMVAERIACALREQGRRGEGNLGAWASIG